MLPTSFDESNAVLGKPADVDHDDCSCLAVLKTENVKGFPVVVSCWKMSAEELEEINRTGRVWLTVMGLSMPPVILNGVKPLGEELDQEN